MMNSNETANISNKTSFLIHRYIVNLYLPFLNHHNNTTILHNTSNKNKNKTKSAKLNPHDTKVRHEFVRGIYAILLIVRVGNEVGYMYIILNKDIFR
jgi:hypothetical protein